MPELANCSRCGAVFAKEIRNICRECYQEEEKAFQVVYRFLKQRKNREARLAEIVRETKVAEAYIIKFIKENRLRQSEFKNLSYPCERCGRAITTGDICTICLQDLQTELKRYEAEKNIRQRNKEEDRKNTYVTLDLDKPIKKHEW